MEQGIFDDLRQGRITQQARAVACIQRLLDALPPFRIAPGLGKMAEFFFPLRKQVGRQTVGETEDDVLRRLACFPMGQASAVDFGARANARGSWGWE